MKIKQYILYNSSGSPTPPIPVTNSINLGLIVGICIPILVISNSFFNLVVIIILYFVNKRFFGNND